MVVLWADEKVVHWAVRTVEMRVDEMAVLSVVKMVL